MCRNGTSNTNRRSVSGHQCIPATGRARPAGHKITDGHACPTEQSDKVSRRTCTLVGGSSAEIPVSRVVSGTQDGRRRRGASRAGLRGWLSTNSVLRYPKTERRILIDVSFRDTNVSQPPDAHARRDTRSSCADGRARWTEREMKITSSGHRRRGAV